MNEILQVFGRLTLLFLLFDAVSLGAYRPEPSRAIGSVSVNEILTQFNDCVYDSLNNSVIQDDLGLQTEDKSGAFKIDTGVNRCSTCTTTEAGSPTNQGIHDMKLAPKREPVFRAIKAFDQLRTYNIREVNHETLYDVCLTAYSLDVRSTGKTPASADYGITFSGTRATVGRTVAVDPRIIPIGTPVYIEGIGWRIAEDTGGAVKGRHIDILLSSEEAAIRFGVKRHVNVYVPIRDPISVMATSAGKP